MMQVPHSHYDTIIYLQIIITNYYYWSRILVKFTKMQGAGNDYLYIDARDMERDWEKLSRDMSDRHFGVGSDGIILIQNSDSADLKMRMFNADGSEGEMCGNGIRCFTKYAIDREIVPSDSNSISVETLAGIRKITPMFADGNVVAARVSMGKPILSPDSVPVMLNASSGDPVLKYPVEVCDRTFNLGFVSMGNPHAVTFIDEPVEDFPLHSIGPVMENHQMFPNRVNFEIVNRLSDGTLKARVWERGSGETMACGTGACGIGVISRLLAYTQDRVDIRLPGGTLTIEWDGEGEVFLEGPAEEVFVGEWD
jgi:diaminopimelate epimerase